MDAEFSPGLSAGLLPAVAAIILFELFNIRQELPARQRSLEYRAVVSKHERVYLGEDLLTLCCASSYGTA